MGWSHWEIAYSADFVCCVYKRDNINMRLHLIELLSEPSFCGETKFDCQPVVFYHTLVASPYLSVLALGPNVSDTPL